MDKEKIEELLKNKKYLNKNDVKSWSKEQLIENCLFLYENNLSLDNKIISLHTHWKKVLNNITCSECVKKFKFDELGGVKLDRTVFCQDCLKKNIDRVNGLNKEPNKEELEEQLKYLEEVGVKQYLANSEQIYLNQIENIKKKILTSK